MCHSPIDLIPHYKWNDISALVNTFYLFIYGMCLFYVLTCLLSILIVLLLCMYACIYYYHHYSFYHHYYFIITCNNFIAFMNI